MRNTRLIEHCRCYHLISRLAHRAFFLDDVEKTRAVELLRRVEAFSGVVVLAYAILALLSDGPMKPAALRKAIGIRSRIHFNRYYLAPLQERGLIVRTDPDHPNSPHQEYKLA